MTKTNRCYADAKTSNGANDFLCLIAGIAVCIAVVVIFMTISWMGQACNHEPVMAAIKESSASSCFDFWFNRYQTFVAAILTVIAALFAGIPVWRTLSHTRRQVEQQQHQMLRQRSYELAAEKNALFSIVAKLEVAGNTLVTINKQKDAWLRGTLSIEEPLDLLFDGFGPAIRSFEDASSRAWGDGEVNRIKDEVLNAIYSTASTFRNIKQKFVNATPLDRVGAFELLQRNSAEYMSMYDKLVPMVQRYVDFIEVEISFIRQQISYMERALADGVH